MQRTTTLTKKRIAGYDFARGIAVFGMFLMNFKIVMQNPQEPVSGFWALLLQGWEGRFGALFIILAGIGVSLMTRRARVHQDVDLLKKNRRTLLLRAGFLFVLGCLFIPFWEADILHFYGIYIVLAVLVVRSSEKWLTGLMTAFTSLFVLLFLLFDWEAGWNWFHLTYEDFWTVHGFLRNTFFNGYHPLFPWFAFFLFGMLIGRRDLTDKKCRKRYLLIGGLLLGLCEAISYGIVPFITTTEFAELGLFFNTLSFPPFPLFMVSACCSSLILIILCIIITENQPSSLTKPFIYTGQMVLTHYIAHVVIAMGFLEAIGRLYNQPLAFAVKFSCVYFVISVIFSVLWQERFKKGPLETVMRKISG